MARPAEGMAPGHRFLIALLAFAGCGCLALVPAVGARSRADARPSVPAVAEPFAAVPVVVSSPVQRVPTPALGSFTAKALAGDEQLFLTWDQLTNNAVSQVIHLDLYRVVNGDEVKVGSTRVGQTVEPDHYTIPVPPGAWFVRATPQNEAGFGPTLTSRVVTIANPCPTATICARVSSSPSPTAVRLAAQGFLHGVDGAGVNRSVVQALLPRQWRYAGAASDQGARGLGVQRTQVLSDLWSNATAPANLGYARTPWSNWAAWTSFVQSTVRAAGRDGWAPDLWDVWNEPNGTCCPRFSPVDMPSVTVSNWLQTYERAWRAIKSVNPAAKVIGPSLSALQWAPGSPAEFDLDTFLAYSAAHHLVWDAVSWHENTAEPSPGDIAASVTNVDRHIAMARSVMARHPGTVVKNAIIVNEYGPKDRHMLPGWAVGYFRAFENGGVSQANAACWTAGECNTQLDGLLTASRQKTALWWAHQRYAQLQSGARMNVVSSSSWQLDGLATRSDPSRTVRVLLGRHWGCSKPVNPWCAFDARIAPASLAVTIAWPYGTGRVSVTSSRLPAGIGAVTSPPGLGTAFVRPRSGTLTVRVPAVNDGDAISIVARPG